MTESTGIQTTTAAEPAPATPKRRLDVLGLIAVILAVVGLAPAVVIFLVGLVPDLNAIWWLFLVVIPAIAVVGGLVVVLGVIGIVVAVRRRSRYVLSIIGIVLGLVMLAPIGLVYFGSSV